MTGVGNHHAQPALAGCNGGGQTSRPAAGDEDIGFAR
jgi:hypothetical protein